MFTIKPLAPVEPEDEDPHFIVPTFFWLLVIILSFPALKDVRKLPVPWTPLKLYILNACAMHYFFLAGQTMHFVLETIIGRWLLGDFMCKSTWAWMSLNKTPVAFFLLAMSIDRFLVVHKLVNEFKWGSFFLGVGVCVCVWAVAILGAIMKFSLAHVFVGTCLDGYKILSLITSDGPFQSFSFLDSFFVSYVVPMYVSIFLNVLSSLKLRRAPEETQAQEEDEEVRAGDSRGVQEMKIESENSTEISMDMHIRLLKLVKVLVITYAGCWIAYWLCDYSCYIGIIATGVRIDILVKIMIVFCSFAHPVAVAVIDRFPVNHNICS